MLNNPLIRLKEKIPSWDKVASVYAVITLVVYGWTFYWFLHELPAWLQYLQVTEIAVLYLYTLLVNFLESLLLLFCLLLLCVLLPRNWFHAGFVFRGVSMSLFVLAYVIAMIVRRSQILVFSTNMALWFPVFFILVFVFVFLVERITFAKKLIVSFADNATVFLFITIPMSMLAFLVIAFRVFIGVSG